MSTDTNNSIKGIERGRASFSFKCATEGAELSAKKEYKSYVKSVPMLIKTNGLAATLGFMLSKGGTYEEITKQILEWIKKTNILKDYNIDDINNFLITVVNLNSTEYRYLTNEILSFLVWLKRFASGLIKDN